MRSYLSFVFVIESGFGRLEDPLRGGIHLFACVDLHAFGGEGEERMLAGERSGRALLLGEREGREEEGCGEQASHGEEQFRPTTIRHQRSTL